MGPRNVAYGAAFRSSHTKLADVECIHILLLDHLILVSTFL